MRKRPLWKQNVLIGLVSHGLKTPVGDALLAQGERSILERDIVVIVGGREFTALRLLWR
jgi:hypothetical protein